MSTPAKILKKPDTDLSELDDNAVKKLAGGVVKRTVKLVLEAGDEPSAAWNEPVEAFLRVAAHMGIKHPLVAGAMIGLLDKEGPAGVVTCLVELASGANKDGGDETVRNFLKLLRGELLSGDAERAAEFRTKADELEATLQGR